MKTELSYYYHGHLDRSPTRKLCAWAAPPRLQKKLNCPHNQDLDTHVVFWEHQYGGTLIGFNGTWMDEAEQLHDNLEAAINSQKQAARLIAFETSLGF